MRREYLGDRYRERVGGAEEETTGRGGSGRPPEPPDDDTRVKGLLNDFLRQPWRQILGGILAFWCVWTMFFFVSRNENSVIQRFGKHVRTVGPGLQFKLPWPIESATEVAVTDVRRMEIGFRTVDGKRILNIDGKDVPEADVENNDQFRGVPREDEMLTGDMNIVILDFVVQYSVSDAAKWLFRVRDPEQAVNFLAQGAMRLVAGGHSFDDVATTGRSAAQAEAERLLQELCDKLDFGAKIVAVQLQDAHPPKDVMPAFQDVTNAREDKAKRINEAQSYRNEKLPQARGTAAQYQREADGYKEQRVNFAKGDADRFNAVYERYRQAPQITLERLRLETIEQVLPGKDQLIDRSSGGVLKLFDTQKKAK